MLFGLEVLFEEAEALPDRPTGDSCVGGDRADCVEDVGIVSCTGTEHSSDASEVNLGSALPHVELILEELVESGRVDEAKTLFVEVVLCFEGAFRQV